jgi:hypothetical protein
VPFGNVNEPRPQEEHVIAPATLYAGGAQQEPAPATSANTPAVHEEQVRAPTTPDAEPMAHGAQLVAPETLEAVPSGHGRQSASDEGFALKVPGGQRRQLVPKGSENWGSGQHTAAPGRDRVPFAHGEHSVAAFTAENVLLEHKRHSYVLLLTASANEPGSQAKQAGRPATEPNPGTSALTKPTGQQVPDPAAEKLAPSQLRHEDASVAPVTGLKKRGGHCWHSAPAPP